MTININDPFKPNAIWAKDPVAPVGRLLLRADPETIRLWLEEFGSEAKMGEYAGLVHGVWWEGDKESGRKVTLTNGILAPTAIFRGLKRPLFDGHDAADRNIYVYITNPGKTYIYPRGRQYTGGPMEERDPPLDSVFAVYVSFELGTVDEGAQTMAKEEQPAGLVVGWEWLEQSSQTVGLPYDYDSRFDSRVY